MKKDFRKNIINLRKQQTKDFINLNSSIITNKLLSMDCIREATNIMLYLDFNNEVQTDDLIKELISLNKIVSSPITLVNSKQLIPHQILDLNTSINLGAYSIREPNKDICPLISISDIDVVIVPGVAYDINRYRLGYGGGFYDRFLSTLKPDAITIGIAFDFQIFDNIPKESHDAQLDYIVTETKVLSRSCNLSY